MGMKLTPDQIADLERRLDATVGPPARLPGEPEPVEEPSVPRDPRTPQKRAKGRQHVPGTMNKTEAAYYQELMGRKAAGEIEDFRFEAVKLRLAPSTFYTPDFMVMTAEGLLEFHEVKGGYWFDDARVKIKVAAEMFRIFRFIAVKKKAKKAGGGWEVEEF